MQAGKKSAHEDKSNLLAPSINQSRWLSGYRTCELSSSPLQPWGPRVMLLSDCRFHNFLGSSGPESLSHCLEHS